MDAETAVRDCGGAARFDRLMTLTDQRTLQNAVRAGALRKPAPGVYAVPDCPPQVLAAVAVRGIMSCHTAAAT